MDLDKQKKYESEMIAFIKKHKIMKWEHLVWSSLPFCRKTAYNYELHKLHTIKDAFEENRSEGMNYLLQKWIKSDNATLNVAAMRIIADEETHQKLNQSYVDHTTKGKSITPVILDLPKYRNETDDSGQ